MNGVAEGGTIGDAGRDIGADVDDGAVPIVAMREVTATVRLADGSDLTTVDGVTLTLRRGSSTAIVGRSGSGKTSLASIIGLLNTRFSGRLLYEGRPVHRWSDAELSRFRCDHVGFVFQNYSLIAHLRVWENVAIPLEYSRRRLSRGRMRRLALRALAGVGLDGKADARPVVLSGGEQQRVAIARALVNNPDMLICDEPTGALDTSTGDEVADMLFDRVRADGVTLVLVTHDVRLAERCQRRLVMERGRLSCSA
ncbi:ABC transporter ATP-binding protein [Bifidobacterium sp. 6T3]|uniref:ABC transporter ATP-binding protein n=2 Tax=Bifidobacterium phasiani TaxID=2834431 RepID=A0ABS6W742_9BIFI|nr:ABC transporter ATP-binding protein [Bifidobacterium phasiani]